MHRGYEGTGYDYSTYQPMHNRYQLNHTLHHPPHSRYQPAYNRYQAKQKWPEDISCVFGPENSEKGSIYVSNVEAAENPLTLKKHNIKAVLTCAKGYHTNIPKSSIDMFEYFPCDDKDSCPISVYFEKAADFIMKALQTTNILVHCIAGVSRSVTLVIAYLIREKNMSFDQAYQAIKKRRKIISPNNGFIRQLKIYSQAQRNKDSQTSIKQRSNNSLNQTSKSAKANRYELHNKSEDKIRNNDEDYLCSLKRQSRPSPRFGYDHSVSLKNMQLRDHSSNNNQQTLMKTFSSLDDKTAANNPQTTQVLNKQVSGSTNYCDLNKQMNDKILSIRRKYETERQKILKQRDHSTGARINYDRKVSERKTNNYVYDSPVPKRNAAIYTDSTKNNLSADISHRYPFKYADLLSENKYGHKFNVINDRSQYSRDYYNFDGYYRRGY